MRHLKSLLSHDSEKLHRLFSIGRLAVFTFFDHTALLVASLLFMTIAAVMFTFGNTTTRRRCRSSRAGKPAGTGCISTPFPGRAALLQPAPVAEAKRAGDGTLDISRTVLRCTPLEHLLWENLLRPKKLFSKVLFMQIPKAKLIVSARVLTATAFVSRPNTPLPTRPSTRNNCCVREWPSWMHSGRMLRQFQPGRFTTPPPTEIAPGAGVIAPKDLANQRGRPEWAMQTPALTGTAMPIMPARTGSAASGFVANPDDQAKAEALLPQADCRFECATRVRVPFRRRRLTPLQNGKPKPRNCYGSAWLN